MFQGVVNEIAEMNNYDLQNFIQKKITHQLINMFAVLEREEEIKRKSRVNAMIHTEDDEQQNLSHLFTHSSIDFTIEVQSSQVAPNAGQGVFVKMKEIGKSRNIILPGTVVTLYPGKVHLTEYLINPQYLQSLLPDPQFELMVRTDQVIIDGRNIDMKILMQQNAYALGHLLNHCGQTKIPNLLQVTYDYPDSGKDIPDFPRGLRHRIPNQYAHPPSMLGKLSLGPCCMKGLVFIATEVISDGDELLIDYKLKPSDRKSFPTWYESYDEMNAQRRWDEKPRWY
jgi:hypothetical protein